MAVFVSVRGWIEANDEQMSLIKFAILNCNNSVKSYQSAWLFSTTGGNSNFAFFGCTIREQMVEDMRSFLETLAIISSVDGEFTDYPIAVFHLKHEDESVLDIEWKFAEGKFVELS